MPICRVCKQQKDDDDFKSKRTGRVNKSCRNCLDKTQEWREQHPDYKNKKALDKEAMRKYHNEYYRTKRSVKAKRSPVSQKICNKLATLKSIDTQKQRGFDLTIEQVVEMLKECQNRCSYCDTTVKIIGYESHDRDQFTVDRIDDSVGHKYGNCVIACFNCNNRKCNTSVPWVQNEEESQKPRFGYYNPGTTRNSLVVAMSKPERCFRRVLSQLTELRSKYKYGSVFKRTGEHWTQWVLKRD